MAMDKPSDKEGEFFIKMEAERLKKLRHKLNTQRAEAEKNKCDSWMKCPKCGGDLEETKFHEVMIDKCKKCSGIWLDAGELEILTEAGSGFFKKLFKK